MGQILENTQGIIESKYHRKDLETIDPETGYDLDIFTDSMLNDIQPYLLESDVKANINCYSGK